MQRSEVPGLTHENTMKLRTLSIGLSTVVLVGVMCVPAYLGAHDGIANMLFATLFLLPFCGFPPIVSMVIAGYSKASTPQIITATASFLYGIWFIYIANLAFSTVDAQGGLIFLFVGIYALPVLLPLWITALVLETRHRKKQAEP